MTNSTLLACFLALLSALAPASAVAQPHTLFQNVRVLNTARGELSPVQHVLVQGQSIRHISATPISPTDETLVLDGGGRTLMPGLIDMHTHLMFATVSQVQLLNSDIGFMNVAAVKAAHDMLLRGFTSVRDVGGPVFGLKKGIDAGLVPGPRIWPAGATISQTGGHGDFRLPVNLPAQPGSFDYTERIGATAVADSPDAVRQRVREQLALGASQIKVMAGGGVASNFDPLDVTQYSLPEIQAAVEAAENWGTYVTVHAYTPRSVRQAINAGVKCIEHGQLLDEATVKLMAEKGVWWSLQPFSDDRPSSYPEGSPNRRKQLAMFEGTDLAYRLARKYKVKTAWGTDTLFSAEVSAMQNHNLVKMSQWYTSAEVLRMATTDNAELLALSGLRSPYPGQLGAVAEGALADLLLVDGNPLDDLPLMNDPAKNFRVIMKDGHIYKNTLP